MVEKAPDIPHVSANYVSVQQLISNTVQHSYANLLTVLRTLPSVSADVARKREFLNYIIQTRQQFVKLYVLCKWAVVAPDISKCIDVANWLHGQTNCFNNVVGALWHLQQQMSTAKLPHADIETALQVLKYGGPTQDSGGFLPPAKLTAQNIAATLKNLNVLLAIRLALVEQLSPAYRNYTIRDGRAKFLVANSMRIDVGVADDSVEARFFFVDFAFDFDFELSDALKSQIEVIVNQKLMSESLQRTLDWCLQFTSNCKLAALDAQLTTLESHFWSKVLKHTFVPGKSLLLVNYWQRSSNVLKFGINHAHNLQLQLLIEDEECPIPEELALAFQTSLDINELLTGLAKLHAKRILEPLLALSWVEKISDSQLALNFCKTRSALLAIDYSSGKISLQASGILLQRAEEKLADSTDIVQILQDLRLLVIQETIKSRAQAMGWQGRTSIRLEPAETLKFGKDVKMVLCLRLDFWPEGWFVVVALGHRHDEEENQLICEWFASQLLCIQKRWSVETLHSLQMASTDPEYGIYEKLAQTCTKQFTMYELCREMDKLKVKYKHGNGKMQLYLDLSTIDSACLAWAFSGIVANVSEKAVELQVHIRGDHLRELGPISQDGIELKSEVITLQVHRDAEVIPQIRQKLSQINKIATWLRYATKSSLVIRQASLNSLELNYTKDGVLILEDNSIRLTEDNPQKFLAPFLPPLLARGGLFAVIGVLTVLFPTCEVIRKLDCIAIPHSMTMLRIQHSLEDNVPQLYVELKSWRDGHVIYLTGNDNAKSIPGIKKMFTVPSLEGCVPLREGVAVPIDKSEELLTRAVNTIKA